MRDGGQGVGKCTGVSISFAEDQLKRKKFHEARQKAGEGVAATGTPIPNNFQLMATISGGLCRDRLYRAGSEAAYLRVQSSRGVVGLPPCCLETAKDHETG
ncbi:hypothetical protein M9H77_19753 [Catharanthus roseus]|uniref:Uncharacterized protein n=1 Tax=Catharanthus roseus TaxID=4058 RepID=A0ACC0BB81_CATRO|nr:hypothetical protein M9H77_19753 [Catharanthus roseus]